MPLSELSSGSFFRSGALFAVTTFFCFAGYLQPDLFLKMSAGILSR
jgi:hypothetical protein